MGTLDDAIREHLDLKRRAGASADEVRKLESEALGPARRDAAPPEAQEESPAAAAPAEPDAHEPEPATSIYEPEPGAAEAPPTTPVPDEPPAREPEPTPEPAREPEPAAAATPAPETPAADEDWLDEDPFGDAGPDPKTTGNPPSDYVAPDDEGEDLLEETPDFLQETPEHDRLWFEQKPPRDFDFDN